MDVTKEEGPANAWPDLLGNVAMNLGVCPRAIPKPNLQKSDGYLDFFARTLDFAVFPHFNRHPQSTAAGIGRQRGSIEIHHCVYEAS